LSEMERQFRPKAEQLGTRKRTANGSLVINVLAVKNNFDITYKYIRLTDYNTIKDLWETGGVYELRVEQEDGGYDTYQVAFDPTIQGEYWRKVNHPSMGWVYQNVSFRLEEV